MILLLSLLACGEKEPPPTCLPDAALPVLTLRVEQVLQSGALLSNHGSAAEWVAQFTLPGFLGDYGHWGVMPGECTTAGELDEYCDEAGLCWRIACTGEFNGHETRARLESTPFEIDGYTLSAGSTVTRWVPSTGPLELEYSAEVEGPDGLNYSAEGQATVDRTGVTVFDELYPSLMDGDGALSIERAEDDSYSGGFTFGGEELASWVDGALVPRDVCNADSD